MQGQANTNYFRYLRPLRISMNIYEINFRLEISPLHSVSFFVKKSITQYQSKVINRVISVGKTSTACTERKRSKFLPPANEVAER